MQAAVHARSQKSFFSQDATYQLTRQPVELTTGVVAAMTSGVTPPPCTVQLLDPPITRQMSATALNNPQFIRYRLLLSDGRHSCTVLAKRQLNAMLEQLPAFSIVQLVDYFHNVFEGQSVICVRSMVPVDTHQQWQIGRPEYICHTAIEFFATVAGIAWGQLGREWSWLLDLEAIGPGRARAMLRAGANPHVRARPDVPSPLQLAHKLRESGSSCEAAMLVISAATWSPGSHALWPEPARRRAVDLACLGWRLGRSLPLDGHHEQAVADIWFAHVMPRVLAFEYGRTPLTELLRERSLQLVSGRPSISWTHDGKALLRGIERLRCGPGPACELTHPG